MLTDLNFNNHCILTAPHVQSSAESGKVSAGGTVSFDIVYVGSDNVPESSHDAVVAAAISVSKKKVRC